MAATAPHVVSGFMRASPGVDLRPLLKEIKTPTLVLAAERLQGEVLGEFRKTAELLPHGRLVVFPGVTGFVQHLLPVPWRQSLAGLRHEPSCPPRVSV
jgi:pimeloyl-ACP methyl ester carboxylesterase